MQENSNIEFKSSFNDAVIETLVAFANTKGGEIYLGVKDSGQPIPNFKIGKESLQKWINEIKLKTHPVLIPDVTEVIYKEQTVVKFSISEFPIKPVSFKGRFYKRVMNSNHLLPLDDIVNLHTQSIKSSFDSVFTNLKIEDLRTDLIDRYFSDVESTGRFKLTGDKLFQLNKLGLLAENKVTLASALLFANHNTAIHIGRFKTKEHILDDVLLKSPLLEAVDEAILFIKKHIKLEYRFTDKLKRDEVWQFPIPAIRELLLNSIIHKDYRNPTDVIIKIFDDKIEFVNPGILFGNFTIDDYKTDDYKAYHRNKLLAESFYLIGEVEKYGTGFIRIRKYLKEYPHLELKLEHDGFFFKVSIIESPPLTPPVTPPLTELENTIISLIRENNKISRNGIAIALNVSKDVVKEYMKRLKDKGILRRVGGNLSSGYWEVMG